MPEPAPYYVHTVTVEKTHLDYNGHMNDGVYVSLAGFGFDAMIQGWGMDETYRAETGCTTYTLETHAVYMQEAKLGDNIAVRIRVLDADEKRAHILTSLSREADGEVFAAVESMQAHVNQNAGPKTAPWPKAAREGLFALRDEHAKLPPAPEAGRVIGIRRRPQA
ncbi:MAG: thioesterase family protein [Rhodospirillales bacterium]